MGNLELQIVQGVLGLLSLLVSAGVTYFAPKLKALFHSATANRVIDGLSSIAESVVQDLNQRVVADAKANGVWTPELAQAIKADAVQAVKDQGAALVKLGQDVLGDVDGLISTLVEHAVAKAK
jgi:hypothetical protein